MLDVIDRYQVMMTRFKLSEDFQTKMCVAQFEAKLAEVGMTTASLVQNTKHALNMMRAEAEDAL